MEQIREIIMNSASKSDALEGKVVTGGLINAKNALQLAAHFEPPRPPQHAPQRIAFTDIDPAIGFIGGTVIIDAAIDEADIEYYAVYFVSGAGFQLETIGRVNASGSQQIKLVLNRSL